MFVELHYNAHASKKSPVYECCCGRHRSGHLRPETLKPLLLEIAPVRLGARTEMCLAAIAAKWSFFSCIVDTGSIIGNDGGVHKIYYFRIQQCSTSGAPGSDGEQPSFLYVATDSIHTYRRNSRLIVQQCFVKICRKQNARHTINTLLSFHHLIGHAPAQMPLAGRLCGGGNPGERVYRRENEGYLNRRY